MILIGLGIASLALADYFRRSAKVYTHMMNVRPTYWHPWTHLEIRYVAPIFFAIFGLLSLYIGMKDVFY